MVICFAQMDVSEREGDFDIFLNPSFGGQNPSSFAEEFANWCPDEEISRQFNASDIRTLLDQLEQDDSRCEVST